MANFHSGRLQAKDPDAISVGTSSIQLIPDNYTRAGLTVINISPNFVSLSFGGTAATIYRGITLSPNGGSWTMDEYTFNNEQVNVVASGANSTVCVQEYL